MAAPCLTVSVAPKCIGLWTIALALSVAGCRADETGAELSSSVLVQAVAALPSNVGSYRVSLTRVTGNSECGSALTSLTGCQSGSLSVTLNNACSGEWVLNAAATQTFASADCSGVALNAAPSLSPALLTLGYGSTGTVTINFQGASGITADATFTSGATAPSGGASIQYRAQRTVHPDNVSCGPAVSTLSSCAPLTVAVDPAAQLLSTSACSGQWIVCGVVYAGPNCTGLVTERGVSAVQSVTFGTTTALSTTTQVLGPNCPF